MLVSLHQALLHSIEREQDALVLAATLRALGTLLLGAPYHRLPPQLLPLCVRVLNGCLARTTPRGGAAALPPELLPVASACLACLAAAFSSKDAAAALAGQLFELAESSRGDADSHAGAAANGTGSSPGRLQPEQSPPSPQQHQPLLRLLFNYAECPHPALQLEALMALRGIAQQHAALLEGCWERLLALGRAGAALPSPSEPQSPRSQQGAASTAGGGMHSYAEMRCTSNRPLLARRCWPWALGVLFAGPLQYVLQALAPPVDPTSRGCRRHCARESGTAGGAAARGLPASGRRRPAGRLHQGASSRHERTGSNSAPASSGRIACCAGAGGAVAAAC